MTQIEKLLKANWNIDFKKVDMLVNDITPVDWYGAINVDFEINLTWKDNYNKTYNYISDWKLDELEDVYWFDRHNEDSAKSIKAEKEFIQDLKEEIKFWINKNILLYIKKIKWKN